MKRDAFERNWSRLARAARPNDPPLPPAPVHRVAEWLRVPCLPSTSGPTTDLWLGLAWRGVAAAAVLLLVSLWFAWSGGAGPDHQRLFRPGLEQAVTDGFWLL